MNITEEIREELQKSIDEEYRKFHGSLVPDMGEFLGVRVPKLRQLAKQAAKEGYWEITTNANPLIYEELMIRGMMIGYGKLSMEEQQEELNRTIRLYHYKNDKDDIYTMQCNNDIELRSLRHMNEFDVYLLSLERAGVKIILDEKEDSDEVYSETKPEPTFE